MPTFIRPPCLVNTHMDETFVRLVCPECTKEWQRQPGGLPASDRTFQCPNCQTGRQMAEFTRTEHDLRTLQTLG
jgi:predicted RNA-binding Zn-ribbon protein involved in translation (DUF1610 family)